MPIPDHVRDRATVSRARVKEQITLPNVTDAEVDAALASVDQAAVYDAQRATWTEQVWDRKSPINGVPAEHFLNRGDVPETGDVYLLLRNGQVVGFQPHEPEREGIIPIPRGRGLARAKEHADTIAADSAAAEVIERVRARLAENRKN